MTLSVRKATVDDARAIAAIYAHHVLHGTATYEVVPPTEDETVEKILTVSGRGWPFLVACDGDQVVGYAYATQFRDRPAYAYACENSIYVAHDRRGGGIGKLLLKALLEAAEALRLAKHSRPLHWRAAASNHPLSGSRWTRRRVKYL
jgi:phosphinothricin acetyltransferase